MATDAEKLEKARTELRGLRKEVKFLRQPGAETLATGAQSELAGLRGEGAAGVVQRFNALLEGLDPEVRKSILKNPTLTRLFLKQAQEALPATELTPQQKIAEISEQKSQRITEGALRLHLETGDVSLQEAIVEVTEATKQSEALRRELVADNALPLSESEFDKRMERIRSVERRGGFGEKSPVGDIEVLQGKAQDTLQQKALTKLSLAVGEEALAPDPEFIREIKENPGSVKEIVEKFSTRHVAAAKINRGVISSALATITGKLSLEETSKGVLSGSITPEAGVKKAGRIRGVRGAGLGALAIPLLLSIFSGKKGGDEPEELDLRQLFLQRQTQELAGSQAKLNSQLGLNDARRSKASAQAEGELLRNLLLMQQVSGSGVSLP